MVFDFCNVKITPGPSKVGSGMPRSFACFLILAVFNIFHWVSPVDVNFVLHFFLVVVFENSLLVHVILNVLSCEGL